MKDIWYVEDIIETPYWYGCKILVDFRYWKRLSIPWSNYIGFTFDLPLWFWYTVLKEEYDTCQIVEFFVQLAIAA